MRAAARVSADELSALDAEAERLRGELERIPQELREEQARLMAEREREVREAVLDEVSW